MWEENIVASIQEVIRTNPYLSYVADSQSTSYMKRRAEPEEEEGDEILFSREALDIALMEEEDADERYHDGETDRGKK